jgi:NAD(P)-dependent dehydrogenase (short-subunit alcohol dehydrogenase family)
MENPMNLTDRVIIVTGAAQGIGRGVALKAASLGARLVLVDINGDGARETAELVGGQADVHAGSVADPAFVQGMVEAVVAKHGTINGLFNNAGIIRTAMIHKMSLADWQAVIDVNLTGVFHCPAGGRPPHAGARRGRRSGVASHRQRIVHCRPSRHHRPDQLRRRQVRRAGHHHERGARMGALQHRRQQRVLRRGGKRP